MSGTLLCWLSYCVRGAIVSGDLLCQRHYFVGGVIVSGGLLCWGCGYCYGGATVSGCFFVGVLLCLNDIVSRDYCFRVLLGGCCYCVWTLLWGRFCGYTCVGALVWCPFCDCTCVGSLVSGCYCVGGAIVSW